MQDVTAQQVKEMVEIHKIERWNIRQCSICDIPIGYLFDGKTHRIFFDSNCGCGVSTSIPQERDYQNVANQFNMQTSPGVKEKMWNDFIENSTKSEDQ